MDSGVLCLKTRVRNISSSKRSFGYLKRIGIWHALDSGEEAYGDGDLLGALRLAPSEYASFYKDLQAGNLVLLQTPTAHFYDAARDTVQIPELTDGNFHFREPCWGHYVSSGGVADGGN